jgi:hypothetical protein
MGGKHSNPIGGIRSMESGQAAEDVLQFPADTNTGDLLLSTTAPMHTPMAH